MVAIKREGPSTIRESNPTKSYKNRRSTYPRCEEKRERALSC
jgi:hypothetical protein